MTKDQHNKKEKFIPNSCEGCGQTTEYIIRLDKGSAYIVISIAAAVRRLNRNRVHLRNDMELSAGDIMSGFKSLRRAVESGYMSSRMLDNVLRPKYFGLVAQVDGGGTGEYLLTPRGAKFIRGMEIEAAAIIDKKTHSKKEYWQPGGVTNIMQLLRRDGALWDLSDIQKHTIVESLSRVDQGQLFTV